MEHLQGFYKKNKEKQKTCDLNNTISCYVPCVCWGKDAKKVAGWNEGDQITATGRLQSRQYNKCVGDGKVEVRTCYEVSIKDIERL